MLTGEIPSFVDAMFEMVSGFTTTGASVVLNVEELSHCTNMWRCFSHWIGGMGILVFLLAVLPLVGGSNMQLMKAESPGPSVGKLVPKVRFTARILYVLYVALTLLQVLVMLLGGMTLYEALCTSFGTAGTGGFGIYGDSIAGFSPFLQWAITIFMIAFGVNFNVYFLLYMRRPKDALHCEEMHWYLGIIVAAALMICANAYDVRHDAGGQPAPVVLSGRLHHHDDGLRHDGFQPLAGLFAWDSRGADVRGRLRGQHGRRL